MGLFSFSVLLVTGLTAGVLSGLMGVGGGTVIVPALVIFLGLTQQTSQGISLAVIVPTAVIGAYGYFLKGNIDTRKGLLLGVSAAFGTVFGSYFACSISHGELMKIFGVFMIIIGGKIIKDVFSK